MKKDDEDFLKQVKNSLDRSEDDIDTGTLTRLHRIRKKALSAEGPGKTKIRDWLPVPLPVLATATAVLLAFFVFTGEREQMPNGNFEDIEILASNNLEFYEELDFYAWLAEEQSNAG